MCVVVLRFDDECLVCVAVGLHFIWLFLMVVSEGRDSGPVKGEIICWVYII